MVTAAFAIVASQSVFIDTKTPIAGASVGPKFLSHGWELGQMVNYLGSMDQVLIAASSHLSPTIVRVGGISGDWYKYVGFDSSEVSWWPSSDYNLTLPMFKTLTAFFGATNMSLFFTLNELFGRNCSEPIPDCPQCPPEWCENEWDMSNVRAFLQRVHDDPSVMNGVAPMFELGNELRGHEAAANTTQDIIRLGALIQSIWSDKPSADRPQLWGPSTDACSDTGQMEIMMNITGALGVTGYSFHSYPFGGSPRDNITARLLNSTWLRSGVLTGSNASGCIDTWVLPGGPRDGGLGLWVTETSSSWNTTLPSPGQNAFAEGFFTLANWGALSAKGIATTMRWAFAESSPFAMFSRNATRWEVAHDFWLFVAMRRALGLGDSNVLAVSGDAASGAILHAYCASNNNGTVIVTAVNVQATTVEINLGGITTLPRKEWIFTAPAGNLSSIAPWLNGGDVALRVTDAGGLPDNFAPAWVDASGISVLTLPPLSQSIFELVQANGAACM
jgi:hypothetical protein